MALTRSLTSSLRSGGGAEANSIPTDSGIFTTNVGGIPYSRNGNFNLVAGPYEANTVSFTKVTGDFLVTSKVGSNNVQIAEVGGDLTLDIDDYFSPGTAEFLSGDASIGVTADNVLGSIYVNLKTTIGYNVGIGLNTGKAGNLDLTLSQNVSYGISTFNLTALNATSWAMGSRIIPEGGNSTWTFGDMTLSGSMDGANSGAINIVANSLNAGACGYFSAEQSSLAVSFNIATDNFVPPSELRVNSGGVIQASGPFSETTVNSIIASMYAGFLTAGASSGSYYIGGAGCAAPTGDALTQIDEMVLAGVTVTVPS